ncbi:MAG TPA: hypothetical protein VF832_03155 [Longimicrobiales bacterium]
MVPLPVRPVLAAAILAAALAVPADLRGQAAARARDDDIAVIVNGDVAAAALTASEARRIFLLRQRFWPGGRRIAPVNLPAASPLRRDFSVKLLGRTVKELSDYWNDLYFHGTEPPPVLDSERAVILYVSRTPGAIGYVREGTLKGAPEHDAVKVVLTVEP